MRDYILRQIEPKMAMTSRFSVPKVSSEIEQSTNRTSLPYVVLRTSAPLNLFPSRKCKLARGTKRKICSHLADNSE